mmetsp:Transcript_36195/g.108402  ORF Transcript_36195/g.108402 Transcript_36195/m.108402 type:complete len:494 (+) Transcript_36195:3590-5071(+)
MRLVLTQTLSSRQKPPCSTSCLMNIMTRCVPYASSSGRLISSQNTTSQLCAPRLSTGSRTTSFPFRTYVQYWAKVLSMISGVVLEEKFRLARTMPCWLFRTDVNVIVLPDPGGPQRIRGRRLDSHAPNTSVWRTVSVVVMTKSVAVTLWLSISIRGTLSDHSSYSPSSTRTRYAARSDSPPSGSRTPLVRNSMSPNFFRTAHDALPLKAHRSEWRSHRRANLSMCSPTMGKSGWFSSYSTASCMPFTSRALRDMRSLSRVGGMMCVSPKANSRASATRGVVRASSPATTIGWIVSRKATWAEGISLLSLPLTSSLRRSLMWCSRQTASGRVSSLNQTMPQRDTVAGVACANESTSRIILTLLGMDSRSPLGRVRSLLSSRTLLRFSAHSGSTSPSNTIQCLRSASPLWFANMVRRRLVKTPSVHSIVVPSRTPYSPSLSIALGSMVYISVRVPSTFSNPFINTRKADDLPTPHGPTSMTPCLVSITCLSCRTF